MCFKIKSGPRGIRTLDLLNAIETRSQLRYGPGLIIFLAALRAPNPPEGGCVRYGPNIIFLTWRRLLARPSGASRLMMDLEGFEPSTSSVRLKRAPNCATGPTINLYFRVKKFYLSGG